MREPKLKRLRLSPLQLGVVLLAAVITFAVPASVAQAAIAPISGSGELHGMILQSGTEYEKTLQTSLAPSEITPGDSLSIQIDDFQKLNFISLPLPGPDCQDQVTEDDSFPATTFGLWKVPPGETLYSASAAGVVVPVTGTMHVRQAAICSPLHNELEYTFDLTVNGSTTAGLEPGCYEVGGVNDDLFIDPETATGTISTVAIGSANCSQATTLEVRKQLSPSTDPGRFDLLIDGTTEKSNAGDGDTTGAIPVTSGSHTVAEESGLGTDGLATNLTHYSSVIDCVSKVTGASVATGSGRGPLNVAVNTGDSVVCTITNTALKGTLVVKEQQVGGPSGKTFAFDGAIAGSLQSGQQLQAILPAGAYTETQILPFGWDVAVSCDASPASSSPIVDVTVAAALVTTCTYTDTYDPLIVSGSFKYDGFMGPGGALVTSGADMATVSGPLASLGGVRSICEDSTWKATKTGGFSSVGFQWNGETYPFTWSNWTLGASDKGTTGSFFSKKYFERPHIANCAFATTAATFAGSDSSENPEQVRTLVPFTGNLLTLDHAATITVTFGNGQGAQIEIPSASGKPGRLKLTSKIVVKFAG